MKKVIFIVSSFLIIGLLATVFGNRGQKPLTSIPISTFLPVLEQQFEALNNKDINSYMKTIHEDSPGYESTKNTLADLFKNYNQTFELVSWEVVSATADEIKVKVVYTIKNAEGSDKKDEKVTATHTLMKSGDIWKVYSTAIDKIEYLE